MIKLNKGINILFFGEKSPSLMSASIIPVASFFWSEAVIRIIRVVFSLIGGCPGCPVSPKRNYYSVKASSDSLKDIQRAYSSLIGKLTQVVLCISKEEYINLAQQKEHYFFNNQNRKSREIFFAQSDS